MKLNLKDLNPGMWFKFEPSDPESGEICLRVLNGRKLAEIRDKTVKTKVEYRDGNRFEYQDPDYPAYAARDKIIWDYCIVDWNGLNDDEDNPIECTTENKIKLMNEHIGFASFVESSLEKLNRQNEEFKEYSEKN